MKKIDLEHVLFWMDAIRESDNRDRTLESFWKGQVKSKVWLIENMKEFVNKEVDVEICGGWNGVLASLLFQSEIPIRNIVNIDIDPVCNPISKKINQIELQEGRYYHITEDMKDFNYSADIIINTSCEHITQEDYQQWLSKIPKTSLLILQSNNYQIDEHVRIAKSLKEFEIQSKIKIYKSVELSLPLYTRWMLIGSVYDR